MCDFINENDRFCDIIIVIDEYVDVVLDFETCQHKIGSRVEWLEKDYQVRFKVMNSGGVLFPLIKYIKNIGTR